MPQIRQQFGAALEALDAQQPPPPEPPAEQARDIYNEAYVKAVRNVTERILHQLNPLIGDIEQAATTEIENFAGSQIKARIAHTKLQVDAIAKLYHAAKPATYEEFDLAVVIRNCLPNDLEHQRCLISFAGPTPLMVHGDPALIAIAVSNGLRNAIEACLPVATEERKPPIVVNWNATDRDYWISILDEGIGYPGSIPGAFEISASTKEGHSGNGLPGVKAAMLSLSGSVELVSQKDKGCALNLSWPIIAARK